MNYRHGMRHKRIYNIWRSMRQRCNNPNCRNYKNYGARGVTVYAEWEDPKKFFLWANVAGYDDGLTIDRIDCEKGYNPDNCRWISQKAQQNNRRNNRRVEVLGHSFTLGEWSELTGVKLATIWSRLAHGWTAERAVLTPVRGKH